MDLNISKAKLTKKGCLEVVYTDKEGNDIVFKGINPVHPDLKDSLNKLIPYIVGKTGSYCPLKSKLKNPPSAN